LFGLSVGHQHYIESLIINPDTNDTTPAINRTLAHEGINTSSLKVINPNTGALYALNTDYTIVNTGGTNGTRNALYTISRVISYAATDTFIRLVEACSGFVLLSSYSSVTSTVFIVAGVSPAFSMRTCRSAVGSCNRTGSGPCIDTFTPP
jgi:hypothetical protein